MRIVVGLFAVAAITLAYAEDGTGVGRRAFEQQDYAKAIEIWSPLAEQGNAEAQFGLGVMYEKGLGFQRDYAEAARLYRRSAQQGYAPAQFNLGAAYEAGRGVPRDLSLAASWWRKAAEQSFGRAAYNLATLYYYGWGVPQNYEEAANWYERAVAAGDPSAARILEGLKKKLALVPGRARQPAPAERAPSVELKGEAWLLDQPADSYTLQIFANWTEASVRRFADESGLGPDTAFFAARYQEYPWFVLVHGVFPTESAAQRALESLPSDVKLMGPWIRPMADVQRLIRDRVVDAAPRDVVIDPLRSPSGEARELLAIESPSAHVKPKQTADKSAPSTPAPAKVMTAQKQPAPKPAAQPVQRPAGATEVKPVPKTGGGGAQSPERVAKASASTAAIPPETANVEAASPADDPLAWIRSQPRGRYTIQVIAQTGLSAARDFVADNRLGAEAAYFAARHDGRLWYPVVLGSFDSLAAARARLAALPEAWRKWAPWIRDFGGIQDIMLPDLPQEGDSGQPPPAPPPASRTGAAESRLPGDPRQRLYMGQKAFNAGRYGEAEHLWRPLAEAGMGDAQYNLGFLYESGWGVPVDYAQAAQWYHRAARQGHGQAQNNLGRMYLEGLGVARDVEQALRWLRAAANGGNADAARFLAEAYQQGRYGLPQDSDLARYWSERGGGRG